MLRQIPALDLDSWVYPNDDKAVMIYPADDATQTLFDKQARLSHGLLLPKKWEFVRFVKPHNIDLLDHFHAIEL
jgi:hypothetical protein